MCIMCELSQKDALLKQLFADTPRPCRTTSAPPNTGPFPPSALAGQTKQSQAVAVTAEPTPKRPSNLHASAKLETPEKPKTAVRNLGIGQALVLTSGNFVYRVAVDIYLYVTPDNVAVHYSVETLPKSEGHLAPFGSKLVIKL